MTDAPKPWDGVPSDPERDGWHWLCYLDPDMPPQMSLWDGKNRVWGERQRTPEQMAEAWHYAGPCHPPSAVTALRDAAWADGWAAGREAAVEAVFSMRQFDGPPIFQRAWNDCLGVVHDNVCDLPVPMPQTGGDR